MTMKKFLAIFALTFTIFFISGRGVHTQFHFFVPLSEAFLKGRIYVDQMKFELHEMIPDEEVKTGIYQELVDGQQGKYYVIFPPLPAVIIMPVVAIFGDSTNQSIISMIVASVSVAISFFVFESILDDNRKVYWMTALYAFGSMLWYHAVVGSGWYFAQVCASPFIWLAVYFTLKKKNLFFIGSFIGLAYLCRFPAILSFPFFLYLSSNQWLKVKKVDYTKLLSFFGSMAFFVAISLVYNWVRYHHLGHYGYTLLELRPYNINNEYSYGSYSINYVTRNFKAMLDSFPKISNSFPYLIPNMTSMALWFVFPAILLMIKTPFRNKLAIASLLAIICVLPSTLLHGGVGSSQFGYRYALDIMPFLLILIALSIKKEFLLWQKTLIILSIIVNFWGIWFNFWRS